MTYNTIICWPFSRNAAAVAIDAARQQAPYELRTGLHRVRSPYLIAREPKPSELVDSDVFWTGDSKSPDWIGNKPELLAECERWAYSIRVVEA
jgi:hypothetical protein